MNWNLDTWDWNSDGNTIYQNVVNGLQQLNPNSIVHLAHDRIAHSVEQVPRIISAIRGYGYRFVTIDECLYGSGGSSSLTWQMRDCQPQPPPGAVCGDHQVRCPPLALSRYRALHKQGFATHQRLNTIIITYHSALLAKAASTASPIAASASLSAATAAATPTWAKPATCALLTARAAVAVVAQAQ